MQDYMPSLMTGMLLAAWPTQFRDVYLEQSASFLNETTPVDYTTCIGCCIGTIEFQRATFSTHQLDFLTLD